MGRFFLGVITMLLILVLTVSGFWLLDLAGVIKLNKMVLNLVSSLPGLEDLTENYELGKKRSEVLAKKEQDLKSWQSKLKLLESKLVEATANFETEKLKWEKEHLAKVNSSKGNDGKKAPANPVSNIDKYLAMVGGMKPAKAAAVLQKLPQETSALILERLRANQAAKIMENLPAEYVAELTQKRINNP